MIAKQEKLLISAALLSVMTALCAPVLWAQGSEYYFPHVADGAYGNGFYSTSFLFNNVFGFDNPVSIRFVQANGSSWPIDLVSNDRPELTGRRSTLTFALRPRESVLLFTGGVDPLGVGWTKVDADYPVVVSEVFGAYNTRPTVYLSSEAGVLASPMATQFSFFAAVSLNEPVLGTHVDTGFAIANPNGSTARVDATLTSRGGTLASQKVITINANSQTALFVSQVFNDVNFSSPFHGTVRFSSNVNIAVVALRQSYGNSDTISTIAVTPDSETSFSVVYDREPNNALATAQPLVTLPAEVIGTMNTPADGADVDLFSVSLRAGDVLYVFGVAELINSPLNASIIIRNSTGAEVAEVDTFSPGLTDPFVRYQVPSTGIYYIDYGSVGNTSRRESNYRLHVLVK